MRIYKKGVVFILIITLFCSLLPTTFASIQNNVDIVISDQSVDFVNKPYKQNDVYFVPLEEICSYLNVSCEKSGNTYTINRGTTVVEVSVGNMLCTVNQMARELEASPRNMGDVAYVPLGLFTEALAIKSEVNADVGNILLYPNIYRFYISEENAAATDVTLPEDNALKTETTAYDGLTFDENKPELERRLFYKFDLSSIASKKIKQVLFNVYATRTFKEYSILRVYKTKPWESGVSHNNMPAQDGSSKAEHSFRDDMGGTYEWRSIDITSLADTVSKDKYLYIGMTGIPPVKEYEPPIIRISSVNGANKAYIDVYTDEIFQFPLKKSDQLHVSDINGFDELKALINLGVIDKNEKIPQNTNSLITREEFVSFAIGLYNNSVYLSDNIDLDDVQDNNMYYKNIAIARSMGIISGGNFRPKDKITIPEAQTILSRILGYGELADHYGGYPVGYRIVAQDAGIMKGVAGIDSALSYYNAFKMIYNSLDAPMFTMSYSAINSYEVNEEETILKKYWDMYAVKGKVTGNEFTNFDETIVSAKDSLYIDGDMYYNSIDEYNNFIGYEVKAFCTIEDDEIVYAGIDKADKVKVIDIQDIDNITPSSTNYKIRYGEKGKKSVTLKSDSTVIYNGKKINLSDYSVDELFGAETGTITVVDDDVFILNMYKVIVVYTVDALKKQIVDRYDPLDKTLRLENYEQYFIKDANYNDISLEQIKENDCLSVAESMDGELVTCLFNRNPITGYISSIVYDDNNAIESLCINGNILNVVNGLSWAQELDLGQSDTFYRDHFGNIVGSNLGKGSTNSMEIGYLLDGYMSGYDDILTLKILSKRSRYYVKYELADKVTIDERKFKDHEKAKEYLTKNEEIEKQVILFTLNQDKQITKIDTINLGNEKNTNFSLNCRYRGQSADLRYKGMGKLGDLFYIDTASALMVREPENKDDISAYTLLEGSFRNDEWLQVDVYTIGNIKPNADAIVVKNYGTSPTVTSRDTLAVFDKVVEEWVEDLDEVYTVMRVYKSDESVSKVLVTEENKSLLNGLNRGDLIRYNSNFENELQAVEKYYDYETKTIVQNPGYDKFNHECRLYGGIAVSKVGDYLKFVDDLNETDESRYKWIRFKGISKAYKYTVDKGIKVTTASLADVQPYENVPFAPTGLMLMSEYEDIDHIWLLEVAQPENTGIYKVSFNGNGATGGGVSPLRRNSGEGITIPVNSFIKEDHEFVAWKDETGNVYNPGDTYIVRGNCTFVALWRYVGRQYKCTFTDGISEESNILVFGVMNKKVEIPSGSILNNEGRKFVFWEDSNGNRYFEGDEYEIKGDETFTAVFEEYGQERIDILESDAAFVVNEMVYGGTDYNGIYSVSENNITANNGVAVLKTTSGLLYYKVDLSSLKGKEFDSVKLKMSVKGDGGSWLMARLYKTSSTTWDASEVNSSSAPGCESAPFIQKTYKYSDYENVMPKNKWSYVEFDLKDALLNDEDFIIGIKVQNADSDGKGIEVQGPTTENPPYIEVKGIKSTRTLLFEGGVGASGNMTPIKAVVNSKVTLPNCDFVMENHDFNGWTDGTDIYSAGEDYIVQEEDVTFTALWKEANRTNVYLSTENCGFTISDQVWNGITHSMYDVSKNNIEANDGIALMRGDIGCLYYKLDMSVMQGKVFETAKLNLYADRNTIGNRSPIIKIYKKESGEWDSTDASTLAQLVFEADEYLSTTFQTSNPGNAGTYFVDAEPRYLEFDITDMLKATTGDASVVIKVVNTNKLGDGIKIYGPTSEFKPYIQFSGINEMEE